MKNIVVKKVTRWIFFSVLISLLPVLFGFSSFFLRGESISFYQSSANGEFFLIAVGLSAGVIGELFSSVNNRDIIKIILGGLICLIMLFSCYSFTDVFRDSLSEKSYLPDKIFFMSISTLGITFFCCLIGLIVSEL
jgi:hypothetical protein